MTTSVMMGTEPRLPATRSNSRMSIIKISSEQTTSVTMMPTRNRQVHIVDDGGQRSFDVMGDVGNQLRAEALGFHPLRHGGAESG